MTVKDDWMSVISDPRKNMLLSFKNVRTAGLDHKAIEGEEELK